MDLKVVEAARAAFRLESRPSSSVHHSTKAPVFQSLSSGYRWRC